MNMALPLTLNEGASTSTIELPCCPISLLAVAEQECHTKVPNHRCSRAFK